MEEEWKKEVRGRKRRSGKEKRKKIRTKEEEEVI